MLVIGPEPVPLMGPNHFLFEFAAMLGLMLGPTKQQLKPEPERWVMPMHLECRMHEFLHVSRSSALQMRLYCL